MTVPSALARSRRTTASSWRLTARPAGLTILVALLFVSVLLPGRAVAQGFSVSPMFVEASLPAGRTAVIPLEVFNSSGLDDQEILFELLDLSQARNGSWIGLDGEDERLTENLSSARSWMRLEDSSVTIPAGRIGEMSVRVEVPPFASGTYAAAILVRTRELGGSDAAVRMQFQFLIPIIIEIEGRPVRQNVGLGSVDLANLSDSAGRVQSSEVSVSVINRGRSFSRFTGSVQVDRRSGEIWRRVTRYSLDERAILPGVELVLGNDIDRRLPPGAYRIRAELMVDGRRIAPLQREFAFEGDPEIDVVAYDTELVLDPPSLDLDALPGGTRTNIVAITNPSDRPVDVQIGVRTPNALEGVAMGGMRGTALSGADWTAIRPETLTIGPRQRRNVRMVAGLPETAPDAPWFYADIVLRGTYDDGQSAGETSTALQLRRQDMPERAAATFEHVRLVRGGEEARFVISARVANTGNLHLVPRLRMSLIDEDGVRQSFAEFESDTTPLLPFGLRDHAAELDIGPLPDGAYLLRVEMLDADATELDSFQRQVRIDNAGGQRGMEWIE